MVIDASGSRTWWETTVSTADEPLARSESSAGRRRSGSGHVETVPVLRRRWLAGTICDQRFAAAIADLEALSLERYPTSPFMRRAYDLRANVTAYDAAHVGLAEGLGCVLLTADRRLAGAPGLMCEVRLLQERLTTMHCGVEGTRDGSSGSIPGVARPPLLS
jgi:predicted nucleic acid-binding protein